MDERLATAYHEAGHGVAAIALHTGLRSLTVEGTEDYVGRTVYGRQWPEDIDERLMEASYSGPGGIWLDARMRRWVERQVMLSVAGPQAEMRATGKELEDTGGGIARVPEDLVEKMAKLAGGPVTSMFVEGDYHTALILLDRITAGDDEESFAWLAWLEVRARRLLGYYWRAVEAIAQELAEAGTMKGARARELFTEAMTAPLLARGTR